MAPGCRPRDWRRGGRIAVLTVWVRAVGKVRVPSRPTSRAKKVGLQGLPWTRKHIGVLGAALRTRPSLQALGERGTAEAKALVNGSSPIGRGGQCPVSGDTGEGGGSIVRRRTWG